MVLAAALLALVAAGCGGGDDDPPRDGGSSGTGRSGAADADRSSDAAVPRIRLVEVGRFEQPVHAVAVPGTDLVAVVEKGGRVVVAAGLACADVDRCPERPVSDGDTIIDISDQVSTGNEQGLLGLAFHPDWPDDPRVFVNYTDTDGDTRIEAWQLVSPTSRAERSRELMRIDQPYENHNGGHLAFGPDGFLYVGMGDGGAGGDPEDRAQQPDERLGKLLRLDVDAGGERGYGIPEGNLADGAAEAWAVGLRNPWRFSFDSETGDLWIGDVGQNEFEEVDALSREQLGGGTPNFGWRLREAYAEFDDSGVEGPGDRIDPVLAYGRDDGCSVTGGVVYRGALVPELDGWYLFADFCSTELRMLAADGVPGTQPKRGELSWEATTGTEQVASFAEVQRGEVLVVSLAGAIHQVLPA